MRSPERIALFGGTFDPIHNGHLMIAREAVETMRLDKVHFLPCRISPHKTGTPPAPSEHRLEMVRIAVRDLDWGVADDFELHAPEPSFSYLTVRNFRERLPDARLFWLMGRDQWESLPRWREPGVLAAELEFIVFSRDGEPVERAGWRLHRLAGTHPASATEIRDSLAGPVPKSEWLPPGVLSYIRENGLYTG